MRIVLCVLTIALVSACGKQDKEASGPVCTASAFPEQVLYPDNVIRKTQVSECDDGCELYDPVDDAAEGFSSCD